jgi:hypothetical protein
MVNQQLVTFVDMAKIDALDSLGEEEEARKIAERYL